MTFLRAFQHLIKADTKIDTLHILSALQEPAKNIDSNSLSKPGEPPALTLETCPILTNLKTDIRSQLFDSTCIANMYDNSSIQSYLGLRTAPDSTAAVHNHP